MKNKIIKYILWILGIVLFLLIGGGIFHRVFIYPSEIRKECAERAKEYVRKKEKSEYVYSITSADLDYKFIYRNCFQENGLQAEE